VLSQRPTTNIQALVLNLFGAFPLFAPQSLKTGGFPSKKGAFGLKLREDYHAAVQREKVGRLPRDPKTAPSPADHALRMCMVRKAQPAAAAAAAAAPVTGYI